MIPPCLLEHPGPLKTSRRERSSVWRSWSCFLLPLKPGRRRLPAALPPGPPHQPMGEPGAEGDEEEDPHHHPDPPPLHPRHPEDVGGADQQGNEEPEAGSPAPAHGRLGVRRRRRIRLRHPPSSFSRPSAPTAASTARAPCGWRGASPPSTSSSPSSRRMGRPSTSYLAS